MNPLKTLSKLLRFEKQEQEKQGTVVPGMDHCQSPDRPSSEVSVDLGIGAAEVVRGGCRSRLPRARAKQRAKHWACSCKPSADSADRNNLEQGWGGNKEAERFEVQVQKRCCWLSVAQQGEAPENKAKTLKQKQLNSVAEMIQSSI